MIVSIVIPTYNRAELLMERALPSVLAQTHAELDVHVVGDGTDQATVDALRGVSDGRVRFTNLPHAQYPDDPHARWCAIGVPALNHGFVDARGEWLGVLADDDAYPETAIADLLVRSEDADLVYGRTEVVGHGFYGEWPAHAAAFTDGAYIVRASLGLRYDERAWERGVPADHDFRARACASLRIAYTPSIVYRYWPANQVPPVYA